MTDGVGPWFRPAHASAFESSADHLFAGGFDGSAADEPPFLPISGVIHAMHLVLEVDQQFTMGVLQQRRGVGNVPLSQRFQHHRASFVLESMTPTGGQGLGGLVVLGMPGPGPLMQMFGSVEEVENHRFDSPEV